MKAVGQDEYGDAGVLSLREIDQPVPGAGEVLVAVRAAGVDPGVWHLMTGRPYLVRCVGFGLRRPRTPVRGRDLAGVVEAIGPGVTRFAVGDEVYGTCERGSYAEFAVAREDRLAAKPARLSFEQAAVVPVSAMTALQAVQSIVDGQRVLVIGAGGGTGTYAVQFAVARGAVVTGVCSDAKADLVRGLGAHEVLDYAREGLGGPYDVIVDTAGNRPLRVLRRALAPHGTLVLVGADHSGTAFLGGMSRQLRTPLVSLFTRQRLRVLAARESVACLESVSRLIEGGAVTPVLDRTYPLPAAADAIAHIGSGHASGKVAITV